MHKGVLARDGATAQVVTDIDETADDAYDEIWPALAWRFGATDLRQNVHKFDMRRQHTGESIAEYEQALRTLHHEAWPKATKAQKDCDVNAVLRKA